MTRACVPATCSARARCNRGCLLELGPLEGERYLEPGDQVTIAAEGLGTLVTPIT